MPIHENLDQYIKTKDIKNIRKYLLSHQYPNNINSPLDEAIAKKDFAMAFLLYMYKIPCTSISLHIFHSKISINSIHVYNAHFKNYSQKERYRIYKYLFIAQKDRLQTSIISNTTPNVYNVINSIFITQNPKLEQEHRLLKSILNIPQLLLLMNYYALEVFGNDKAIIMSLDRDSGLFPGPFNIGHFNNKNTIIIYRNLNNISQYKETFVHEIIHYVFRHLYSNFNSLHHSCSPYSCIEKSSEFDKAIEQTLVNFINILGYKSFRNDISFFSNKELFSLLNIVTNLYKDPLYIHRINANNIGNQFISDSKKITKLALILIGGYNSIYKDTQKHEEIIARYFSLYAYRSVNLVKKAIEPLTKFFENSVLKDLILAITNHPKKDNIKIEYNTNFLLSAIKEISTLSPKDLVDHVLSNSTDISRKEDIENVIISYETAFNLNHYDICQALSQHKSTKHIIAENLKRITAEVLNDSKEPNLDEEYDISLLIEKYIFSTILDKIIMKRKDTSIAEIKIFLSYRDNNFYLGNIDKNLPNILYIITMHDSLYLFQRILYNYGLDALSVKYQEDRSILHIAVIYDSALIVEHLLGLTALSESKDVNGDTPLHYAVRSSNNKIISILLEYDNDSKLYKNKYRETPLHLAIKSINSGDIMSLMLNYTDINERNDFLYKAIMISCKEYCMDALVNILTLFAPPLEIIQSTLDNRFFNNEHNNKHDKYKESLKSYHKDPINFIYTNLSSNNLRMKSYERFLDATIFKKIYLKKIETIMDKDFLSTSKEFQELKEKLCTTNINSQINISNQI